MPAITNGWRSVLKKLGNASLNEQLLLMDVPLQRQLNYLH